MIYSLQCIYTCTCTYIYFTFYAFMCSEQYLVHVHVHVYIKCILSLYSLFIFLLYCTSSLSLSLSLSLLYQLSLNNDVLNFYHHDTSVRLSAITDDTSSPIHSYDDNFFSSVLLSNPPTTVSGCGLGVWLHVYL